MFHFPFSDTKINHRDLIFDMVKSVYYSCALILVLANIASTQIDGLHDIWKWSHFTVYEGLPSDKIVSVVETTDSTVWVLTENGIAWFDGYRWHRMGAEHGLPEGTPQKISTGNHGKLLAIWEGKLYIGDQRRFQKMIFPGGYTNDSVLQACKHDDHSILVKKINSLIVIRSNDAAVISVPPEYTYCKITTDCIWYNTKKEFMRVTGVGSRHISTKNIYVYPLAPRVIAENEKGEGIISFDAPKEYIGIGEWSKDNVLQYSKTERGISVRSMDMFPNGDALAIYETGDVHWRHEGKWIDIQPIPAQMLNASVIRCRKNGDFWIGSENGLFLFRQSFNQWEKLSYPFSDPRNIVMELFQSSRQEMWVGTIDGVEVIAKNGTRRHFPSILGKRIGLVTGINEDVHGNIWISSGSEFYGAYRWDGIRWEHVGVEAGFHQVYIHKIRKGKNGDLYFLSLRYPNKGDGVFVYRGGKFSNIGVADGLLDGRVYAFIEDNSGGSWFGSQEGLSRYKNGQWKHWGNVEFKMMPKVYTLALDHQDNVWFSNYAATLGFIDRNDSIHWLWRWTGPQEFSQKVWDIQCDSAGVVWLATNKGLLKYQDSVLTSCNNGAGKNIRELRVALPLKNKIYVGGHGTGVSVYYGKESEVPLKIEVEEPFIDNDDAQVEWHVYSFWGSVPSQNIETRYKIDQGSWSDWSQDRKKYYDQLSYGQHLHAVQAKDRNSGTIYTSSVTQFEIPLPFYLRPIYYIPFVMLLAMVLFLFQHNLSLRRDYTVTMQQNREKIARDLHDEIGSSLSGIALATQLKARDGKYSESDQKEFQEIGKSALQTANAMHDIVWFINPQNDSMENLIIKMKETAATLLRMVDVQFDIDNPKMIYLSLEARRQLFLVYKEALNNIAKHANAANVQIRLSTQQSDVTLLIQDDGKGFDPTEQQSGLGLPSMKERADACKGKLDILTNTNGTTIALTIPSTNNHEIS